MDGAAAGLITVGSCAGAAVEARGQLADRGLPLGYCRIRAFPFGPEVAEFLEAHPVCYVLEQNRDGQLKSLLVNECGVDPRRLRSVLIYDGLPVSADAVADGVCAWVDDEVPA
jgi:2-oxoglutarate ferredoxin oxidoreductase subunit alpha